MKSLPNYLGRPEKPAVVENHLFLVDIPRPLQYERTCPNLTLHIAAFTAFTSQPFTIPAPPAWATVLCVNEAVALIARPLCVPCDRPALTPLRAMLRAAHATLRFAHMVSMPLGDTSAPSSQLSPQAPSPKRRARPLELTVNSASGYPCMLGPASRHKGHHQLCIQLLNLKACLVANGSYISFAKIAQPSEQRTDPHLKRAFRLALRAGLPAEDAVVDAARTACHTCDLEFANVTQLAAHFRAMHMPPTTCSRHEDCLSVGSLLEPLQRQ